MSKVVRIAPPPPERRITINDAAARLGMTGRSVRRYLAEGRLNFWRIGGRAIRLDSAEVDALLVRGGGAS
jgi:excisionase family DNA binding protein